MNRAARRFGGRRLRDIAELPDVRGGESATFRLAVGRVPDSTAEYKSVLSGDLAAAITDPRIE